MSGVINGVDDLLAASGPDVVLNLFDQAAPKGEETNTQAQKLIRLAEKAELFHTPSGEACARIFLDDHYEVWDLRKSGFRDWLLREFYKLEKKPPSRQALQDAIGVLCAKARYDGPELPLNVRVAELGDKIYIDLCNASWQAVEIDAAGWRVVDCPPVRFRRTRGMSPLPTPTIGGDLAQLRKFINVGDNDNWILCTAWLVAACRERGPFPILLLQGEQGSAKSTTVRVLRRLVDPFAAPIRTPPRDDRDLLIAATNSWMLAYDNVSGIPQWLSDAFCRLATGGGFTTRELYTDSDEVFFDAMRPVVLNGIDQLAERADLADRSVILNVPRIDEGNRKAEADLYKQFEQELPQILGSLYTVVSSALAQLPSIRVPNAPRMADFAKWATAAEQGLSLEPGDFIKIYRGNRTEAIRETLENDAVALAVRQFMEESEADPWTGSCADLLPRLEPLADERTKKTRQWPDSPRGLSGRLRRLATFLREVGIHITFNPKGGKGSRSLTIERKPAR